MKQVARSFILLTGLIFYIDVCYSQNEATLYTMNSLPQVTYVNPAIVPLYRFSIGIPGSSIFFQYANNGFSYNNFATKVADTIRGDLNKLYSALKKKNYITTALQVDLFRLSMKINPRVYLTLNASLKSFNRIMLPKDLPGIFINGTAPYVNGVASISPEGESVSYLETGLGFSYRVNRKLTVGAKFKLLKGIINATTQTATVNLALDQDYAITVNANLDARTSGIHNLNDDTYEISDRWHDYLNNTGFAFDIGATYELSDRFTIGGSLIDIGSITWKNDTYDYKLNPATANYVYRGIDIEKVLNGNTDYMEQESDTLQKRFDLKEGVRGSYRTPLPGKMYLSGNYKLATNFYAGLLLFAEKFRGRFAPGVSASLHKEFGRRVSSSISYTISNSSYNNFGAGISLNFAPLQFYILGDNLLGAPYALATKGEINPYLNSMQYFNLRLGINFVFGREKTQEKLPHPR